jgi:hypothetical protein
MSCAPERCTRNEWVAALEGGDGLGLVPVDTALALGAGQRLHLADKVFFVVGKPGARMALTGKFNNMDHGKLPG